MAGPLKEWRACRQRSRCFRVLVHQDLKGQLLLAKALSSKFHHLASEIRFEELGQPHFDVLKS